MYTQSKKIKELQTYIEWPILYRIANLYRRDQNCSELKKNLTQNGPQLYRIAKQFYKEWPKLYRIAKPIKNCKTYTDRMDQNCTELQKNLIQNGPKLYRIAKQSYKEWPKLYRIAKPIQIDCTKLYRIAKLIQNGQNYKDKKWPKLFRNAKPIPNHEMYKTCTEIDQTKTWPN